MSAARRIAGWNASANDSRAGHLGTEGLDAPAPSGLTEGLVRFCRSLRERGLLVSPGQSIEAARALSVIDIADRTDAQLALRALLTSKPGDLAVFDECFDAFWTALRGLEPRIAPDARIAMPRATASTRPRAASAATTTLARWVRATEGMDEDHTALRTPTAADVRRQESFSTFDADSLRDVQRLARRIVRHLAARRSRRWRPTPRGPRLDLRRTVRAALRTTGDLSLLAYRRRAIRRTRLVVICDVSGSMDLYARLLLQFLFALQHSFARVETFVFATQLSRITTDLRTSDYETALSALGRRVRDWNGGTRIAASLAAFAAEWRHLLDRWTAVVILSDGWDTDDPRQLDEALAVIHRHAGRVIWLNPLLADPRYQPLTRGMQAALPHIDIFAAANNLETLEALAHYLRI